MDTPSVQAQIFLFIKSVLPAHISLADAIAETLDISADSAYRRIRGEKLVTIDELAILAKQYRFSVDRMLALETESYIFSGKLANAHDHVFDKWLDNSCAEFENMAKHDNAHLYYMAKDLPVAQFFHVPELASFKFFFWQKSILQYNELKGVKYHLGQMTEHSRTLAGKIVQVYNKINTSELWSIDTVNSTLRQIEYYHEAGIFENKTDPAHLCDSFDQLIDHLERQAEEGIKLTLGNSALKGSGRYYMYNNELIIGNNHLIVDFGDIKISYLNHSTINYVSTYDKTFNDYHLSAALNMISKSEPLHTSNEKRRQAFFNRLRQKIQATRQATS